MDPFDLLTTLADGECHSGESLAARAGQTRAAVWKNIRRLEQWGISVEAVSGKGYRLNQHIELLDAQWLGRRIATDERFALDRLEVFREIDSTNRYLMNNPPSYSGSLRLCVAEWQSAGRGRLERRWESPLGSGVCLSAAWVYDGVPQDLSALSLAAGVAIADAVRRACGVYTQLKWPNDVVWSARKLGGVLVESSIEAQGRCNVVIGVGLNVSMPPGVLAEVSDWDAGAVDLNTAGNDSAPRRNALVAAVAGELGCLLSNFQSSGAASWLRRWKDLDFLAGKEIRVSQNSTSVDGVAAGIDDTGALLVSLPTGATQRIVAGDASIRRR